MPANESVLDVFSTDHLKTDLKGRSVRGGALTLVSQGGNFLLQTVSTVVLARLLTPSDFGLVAMVVAITGFATTFADLGLSEAIIQRRQINHYQVSTLFWINVAIGLGLTLITVALGPVLAWFYREPRVEGIAFALSLTFLISGLRVQHDALLKRQMRYVSLAIRSVVSQAVGVLVALVIAWRGGGYWALVASPLALNFTGLLLSWYLIRWKPGPPRRDSEVPSMLSFGGNVAATYLVSYLHRNMDNILIGWYWGTGPLGFYSRAYNLLMLPVRQLNLPAASVTIPAFSRIQGDPDRFARYYLNAISLIVWISAPVFAFFFVAAEPVNILVLGKQWEGAVAAFKMLVISALAQPLLESVAWLFVARGQSDRLLKLWLIMTPITIGSFVIGLPFGIEWVALSYSLVLLAVMPWVLNYAFRGTALTLQRLGKAIFCPVSISLVGAAFAELALHLVTPKNVLSQLLISALGFGVGFSLSALLPFVRQEFLSLKAVLQELRPSSQAT